MPSFEWNKLKDNIHLLKELWPEVVLEEVSKLDDFYTDGLSIGSKFKLVLSLHKVFVGSVYVSDDGVWIDSSNKNLIKDPVNVWIEKVKQLQ
jgi:hypothetical protein